MCYTTCMDFPMRINKYLAHTGVSTRTGADELISRGLVTINGVRAKLGDKVKETDEVRVLGKQSKRQYTYVAYNKPAGIVTANPQGSEKGIAETLTHPKKLFPIGRLDKDSHGLIILTDDGRITDRLLNPKYPHEKEYVVTLNRPYSSAFIRHMEHGVVLSDFTTKPTKIKKVNDTTFRITLTEGKNRQIRRMTEKLGYTVTDLHRVRIQNILLGKTPKNAYREITDVEKNEFLSDLGL